MKITDIKKCIHLIRGKYPKLAHSAELEVIALYAKLQTIKKLEDGKEIEIKEIKRQAITNARRHSWNNLSLIESLCLVHSEISEAVEDVRDEKLEIIIPSTGAKPTGLPIEMADAVIRLCHIAERHDIDLNKAIKLKLNYNLKRAINHGRHI